MTGTSVDVVIASNRHHRYLAETIASVRAQIYPHWRILLVDDGSPDPEAMEEAVADVPGARVFHQAAAGVSAARNRGMREGDAPLVVFLDDDDVWRPDRLEQQVGAWERARHHVAVYSGGWYADADGRTFGRGWPAVQVPSRRLLAGEVPLPRIVTLMMRRDALETVGGLDETMRLAEDHDLVLRLARLGELLAVPEALVGYRRHEGNVSTAGVLAGRVAIEGVLRRQAAAAALEGDGAAAMLLREHLRRFRAASASEALRGGASALRARDASALVGEVLWAMRAAPAALAARVTRTTDARVRPRSRQTSLR